jgi:hypothetical protein
LFTGIDSLLAVRPLNAFFNRFPRDKRVCQAASGVASSYDGLLDLFECLGSFLKRLTIYTMIPQPRNPIITEVVIIVMLELLSVLALASKQIKRGWFGECDITFILFMTQCAIEIFARKLIMGESEIETALQRLDRLTQEEARMAVALLGAVNDINDEAREKEEDEARRREPEKRDRDEWESDEWEKQRFDIVVLPVHLLRVRYLVRFAFVSMI